MEDNLYCLSWVNYHRNISSGVQSLLENEDLVDVTLAIEGQYLKAHKMVLSICSPYFRTLFSMNPCKHPIVFMKDVSYIVMKDLLVFMYQGEVNVEPEYVAALIKTAKSLQIKGLTETNEFDETADVPPKPRKRSFVKSDEPNIKKSKYSYIPESTKKQAKPTPAKTSTTDENLRELKSEPYDDDDHTYSEIFDDGEPETLNDSMKEDDEELEETLDEKPMQIKNEDGTQETKERFQRRASNIVWYEGYAWVSATTRGNLRYLRCNQQKKYRCKATAKMVLGDPSSIVITKQEHTHPKEEMAEELDDFRARLKELVQNQPGSLRQIYTLAMDLNPHVLGKVRYVQIESSMRRWRAETLT